MKRITLNSSMWGVLFRSKNRLDGERKHLIYQDCKPILFQTRQKSREWIKENYGYIKNRPDLRAEPHGWRTPKAVRVYIYGEE